MDTELLTLVWILTDTSIWHRYRYSRIFFTVSSLQKETKPETKPETKAEEPEVESTTDPVPKCDDDDSDDDMDVPVDNDDYDFELDVHRLTTIFKIS